MPENREKTIEKTGKSPDVDNLAARQGVPPADPSPSAHEVAAPAATGKEPGLQDQVESWFTSKLKELKTDIQEAVGAVSEGLSDDKTVVRTQKDMAAGDKAFEDKVKGTKPDTIDNVFRDYLGEDPPGGSSFLTVTPEVKAALDKTIENLTSPSVPDTGPKSEKGEETLSRRQYAPPAPGQ